MGAAMIEKVEIQELIDDLRGVKVYTSCRVRGMLFENYGELVFNSGSNVVTVGNLKFPVGEVDYIEFKKCIWSIYLKEAK
jgi:hypothetical protein